MEEDKRGLVLGQDKDKGHMEEEKKGWRGRQKRSKKTEDRNVRKHRVWRQERKERGCWKGKESIISVMEKRAEVRKQDGMRVTPPESYEAYSQQERHKGKIRVQKPSITDKSVLWASETWRNISLECLPLKSIRVFYTLHIRQLEFDA